MAAGCDGSEKQGKEGQGKMYYPIKVHLSDAQPSIRMTCLPRGPVLAFGSHIEGS